MRIIDRIEFRGVQHWYLLAPLLQEKRPLHQTGKGCSQNMSEFLGSVESSSTINAFQLLARPATARASTQLELGSELSAVDGTAQILPYQTGVTRLGPESTDPASRTTSGTSLLEELPAEMLALVLADGDLSMQDILSLGSCSQTLCMHVSRHIYEDCRRNAAPWAGSPLIITGNRLHDLPQTIYNILPDVGKRSEGWSSGWRGPSLARAWNSTATESFEEVRNRSTEWIDAGKGQSEEAGFFVSVRSAVQVPRLIVGEKWVLRNLTTSEFVRLQVKGTPTRVLVADGETVTLDQALLAQVWWSGAVTSPGVMQRIGRWAGHSFDVVTAGGGDITGWLDVTSAVSSQAMAAMGEVEAKDSRG